MASKKIWKGDSNGSSRSSGCVNLMWLWLSQGKSNPRQSILKVISSWGFRFNSVCTLEHASLKRPLECVRSGLAMRCSFLCWKLTDHWAVSWPLYTCIHLLSSYLPTKLQYRNSNEKHIVLFFSDKLRCDFFCGIFMHFRSLYFGKVYNFEPETRYVSLRLWFVSLRRKEPFQPNKSRNLRTGSFAGVCT